MDSYFFRVDHELMRSDAFKTLGGSAIKVYLVIGLYADFGTDWAFPSIRTIAKQAGVSRQTVLTALEELVSSGLLATQKTTGKCNAYRILRQPPARPRTAKRGAVQEPTRIAPKKLTSATPTSPLFLEEGAEPGQGSLEDVAQFFGRAGRDARPKQEPPKERETDNSSVPIPGTPFRLGADGRLQVAVDLQELLTGQGLPKRTAERLLSQKDPEAVAKVLLNALYLQSQGKLQNGPGYIRTGIEEGYELLPQVANRLETRRRELEAARTSSVDRAARRKEREEVDEEQAAIELVLESLTAEQLEELRARAIAELPKPLLRHNATLSNPFVRAKVYELAGGEPAE